MPGKPALRDDAEGGEEHDERRESQPVAGREVIDAREGWIVVLLQLLDGDHGDGDRPDGEHCPPATGDEPGSEACVQQRPGGDADRNILVPLDVMQSAQDPQDSRDEQRTSRDRHRADARQA